MLTFRKPTIVSNIPVPVGDPLIQNTIQDLPAETLLIIFKLLFWASCVETNVVQPACSCADSEESTPCVCQQDNCVQMTWTQDEDLLDPSIFPYATSLVCKHWYALMRSDPSFWTRIVIVLDEDPAPLLKIQSHIDLSGDLPLDVHVLRRQKDRDPREHVRSEPIINFLVPHFHRCRVIAFDLMHNSSLPSIYRDFHGEAPYLVKLQLKCHIDDGQEYVTRPWTSGPGEDFTFPFLEILDVDGKNFADACTEMLCWQESLSKTAKLSMTIANYTPISNHVYASCTTLDFVTVLSSIPRISELHLVNLQFPETWDEWDDEPLPLTTPYLELKDLGEAFVNDFLVCAELDDPLHLHVTRCSLQMPFLHLNPSHLTLEQVPYYDNSLTLFLNQWEGTTLEIIDQTNFSDPSIEALLNSQATDDPHIPRRRNFTIADCPNFGVPALKRFISLRNDAFLQCSSGRGPSPRCTLNVFGYGPALSAEDREWFHENLDSFHWDTKQYTEVSFIPPRIRGERQTY